MKKKTIRVCDDCGVPLIWTFYIDYAERYCLNCGVSGGMLGTGRDEEATRELIFQKKLVDAIWKVLYAGKGLVPRGRYTKKNCVKCSAGATNHHDHISLAEEKWNEIAEKYLTHFQGKIAPKKEEK